MDYFRIGLFVLFVFFFLPGMLFLAKQALSVVPLIRFLPVRIGRLGRVVWVIAPVALLLWGSFSLVQAQSGPALELTKDFGGATAIEVESGVEFTYYISFRCASITQDCNNASITDPLPPEVTYVDAFGPVSEVDTITYDSVNHEVVVDFVDPLGAGTTGVVQITALFPPGTLPGTTAVNQATSSSNGILFTSNQVTATALGSFEMTVDKSVNGDFDDGVIGSQFTTDYRLQVCNPDDAGGVRLTNPIITDTLPAEATFVSASHGGIYDAGSHTIRWTHASAGGGLPDVVPVTNGCPLTVNVQVRFAPNGPDGTPATGDEPVAGNTVLNNMTATGQPEDGTDPVTLTDGVSHTLRDPYFDDGSSKTSTSPSTYTEENLGTEELPGGEITYAITYDNSGTITATNVTITDAIPSNVTITQIGIGPAFGPANGFYETRNAPGVWQPFPDNSYSSNATVPVTTTTTADPSDIELASGDAIAAIRWELGDVPPGAPTWRQEFIGVLDVGLSAGTVIPNCTETTAVYDDGTQQISVNNSCSDVGVINPRAIPRVTKSASDDSLLPSEVTEFTLTVSNADVAHNAVVAPMSLVDLLPPRLELVVADSSEVSGYRTPTALEISNGDWYSVTADVGAPAPTHTYTLNFDGSGSTLLGWEWDAPYELHPGETITVRFYARVMDFTTPRNAENSGILLWDPTTTNPLECSGDQAYVDTQDVDGDGDDTETGCRLAVPVTVEPFLAMDSEKFVWGEMDSDWSDYGYTVTGGKVDYRMFITNTSNVTATNIIAYDIFPYVGDTGVIDPANRESEWGPYLIAPITDTQSLPLTISYSQSLNPCRPEVMPSGPAGCVDDWSTTPPDDITSVTAVRLEFCDSGNCLELAPDLGGGGSVLEFSWHMVAPNNTLVGDVAWNSFAFTADGGGLELLPSEPIRVGVEIQDNTNPGVSIGDYVWLDLAGQQDDGIQQPEETGIRGVRVELWDAGSDTFVDYRVTGPDGSGNAGYYEFINVPAGDYYLRFFPPTGTTTSPANQGGDDALDSDGETTGTDATHGDYIQTAAFTVNTSDDYTWDQGVWVEADYGDAPATYPTEAASQANPADAARHVIVDGLVLGGSVDPETDGQPNSDALGDDSGGSDDEDGVSFSRYLGTPAAPSALFFIDETDTITVSTVVTAVTEAYLNAWIDFNGDGDWDDAGEQIAADTAVSGGDTTLNVTVPVTAVVGTTYARFRLSSETGLAPAGTAQDGEVEDYKIQFLNPPTKALIATSESHTSGSNVAIGEIVRYELTVPVPEGTMTNFVITDTLPAGLQYLDDGTAALTTTADSSLTTGPFAASGGPFGSGADVIFDLGTVTNNDSDVGEETITIAFNALVLNVSGNNPGVDRDNQFTVYFDTLTRQSNIVSVNIVEPNLTVAKAVATNPDDAGDTAVFELTVQANTGANRESAFDLVITDTLHSDLTLQSLSVTTPGYATVTDNSNVPANQVDIGLDQLDPGDTVTVVITATVNGTATAGQTIPNNAYLTYTSLPGTGSSGNITGSDTPGGSGAGDGERDGSGGVNDYAASDSADVLLTLPTVDKQISPASYTIGEEMTFDILVTLPEGVTADLELVDGLPDRLAYVSHQIITTTVGSGGLLTADFGGSLPAPTVNAPGGSGDDVTLDFGDTTTTADNDTTNNSFLVRVTAVVLNLSGNQNGASRTNTATLNYTRNGSPASLSDSVTVNIVEPILDIDKALTTPIPSPLDAGTVITYQIVLQHHSSTAADAYDVVVTDTLPTELTNISLLGVTASGIASPGGDLTGSVLRLPSAGDFDLPQGAVVTATIQAEIDTTAVPGLPIANTAGAVWTTLPGSPTHERTGGGSDPDGTDLLDGGALNDYEVASTASFNVDASTAAKLLVGTSAAHTTGSDVTIGEIITYSLTVNVPEGTIPSLDIVDDLPAGLAYVPNSLAVDDTGFSGTLPAPSVNAAGGSGDDVTLSYGAFTVPNDNDPNNNSFVVTLQAVVLDEAGNVGLNPPGQTVLTNNATVQVGSGAPQASPPVDVTAVEPNIVISKAFNTETAVPNDTITLTLTVTNTGASTAFDLIIDDPLANDTFHTISEGTTPAGFSFSTVTAGSDTIVRYSGGSLAPTESATFTFTAVLANDVPPSPPAIDNVATVTQATTLDSQANDGDDGQERDEPDVQADDQLTVLVPDIALTKDDSLTVASEGMTITYTLTVENVGGADATGVVITDTVPANATFAGPSGWSCAPDGSAGSLCTYALGNLAAGDSTTVAFAVLVDNPLPAGTTDITNTAVAHDDGSHGLDPNPDNNDDSDVDDVVASIGDFVWHDVNGNGRQDAGEVGLEGATVSLYTSGGAFVDSTTTLADGRYGFVDITPGDYYLVFTPPAGYAISPFDQGGDDTADSDADPVTGATAVTTLSTGEDDPTWDAGLYQPVNLGDFVWLDADQDGIQDGDEYGIGGVTVELYDTADALITSTATLADGSYLFADVRPGDYYVLVTPPAGYTITTPDQGGDDAVDSDIDGAGQTADLTLVSGVDQLTWDAGLHTTPAYLGDTVWLDADQNGVQDGDEFGVPGVTVTLFAADGTTLSITTTDAFGTYGFTNLPPADYYVGVTPPAGYGITLQDQGGDDALDSDVDGSGETAVTTLDPGENDPTWDAGLYVPPAAIGDFVWLDADQDGIQDGDEYGVSGVTVNLYDAGDNLITTTTTDANGLYGFTNLPPGDYYVAVVPPSGYTITLADQGGDEALDSDSDGAGAMPQTTLSSGENDTTWDAGLTIQPAAIGDTVWLDADQDGVQDADEFGVPGVTVNLYNGSGAFIDSTTTDAYGGYSFTNLPPGDYFIEVVPPAGYTITAQDQGGDDAADSDIDGVGQTAVTTLDPDENDPDWDGGLYVDPAAIGDTVWHDLNLDGIQDGGEPPLDGVTVHLYDAGDNLLDTTSTDANGLYDFTNLPPGDYYVVVAPPGGYAVSDPDQGADDSLDSDIDPTTGATAVTSLSSGETDDSWDAGLYFLSQDASLGDFVWHDLDNDGVQNAGEPGVPGVTVELYDSTATLIGTTTTDADGLYLFETLNPGDYVVQFTLPAGYDFTGQDQGGDDGADSDADTTTGETAVIRLIGGQFDPTWDAGLIRPQDPATASLGDFVWLDQDGDGQQDVGEPGVAGVTVNLVDSNNVLTGTTTTDANGLYQFTNLTPGDYGVEFILPAGYDFTTPDQGGDDGVDSDADVATGRTAVTNLSAGENDPTWDAGLIVSGQDPLLAALGDFVWRDLDRDGVQDAGEPPVADVLVNLLDSGGQVLATTTTDAGGQYRFTDLTPGDYAIAFVPPVGFTFTAQDQGGDDAADSDADPVTGETAVTSLTAGENDTTWDAGLVAVVQDPALASLGNFVWWDQNGDGRQELGEPGVPNTTVNLFDGGGTLVATTTTDVNGFYLFDNLTPGDYAVEFDPPAEYSLTYANQGSDDVGDSDADPVTGRTAVTTLVAGENDLTWDAGLFRPLRLGNQVWNDLDNDGLLDAGAESGIAGVTVELLDAAGNPVRLPGSSTPLTTTTDANGRYTFTDLPPGTYRVHVPASNFDEWGDPLYGFVSSSPTFSADDAVDGNDSGENYPDPAANGIGSGLVTLSAGTEPTSDAADEDNLFADADSNLTVDFGFFELLTLGNRVWFDTDEDGVQDAGEVGVSGVVLNLLDGQGNPITHPVNNQPMTATTSADGYYQFTNLYPGDYVVQLAPENFQTGGPLQGYWSSEGEHDPNDDADTDDNGIDHPEPWVNGIYSAPVTLSYHLEPDQFIDTDDNDNTNLSVDFGLVATPTAVELTSFTATRLDGQQVQIRWETASEIDNFGFRLYRSAGSDFDSATQIHFEPSAVPGGSGPGTSYQFVDTVPDYGTWTYWLEDVETGGATAVHGPISINVQQFYHIFVPLVVTDN